MPVVLNIDEILKINFIPIDNLCEAFHRDVTWKKIKQILKYYDVLCEF